MMRARFRRLRRPTSRGNRAVQAIATCIALLATEPALADGLGRNAGPESRPMEVQSEQDRSELESLFTRWHGRQSEIVSARISYRSFHNSVDGEKSFTELAQILDAGLLDSSPDGFRAFIAAANGAPYRIDPPWGEGRIVMRDSQRRSDLGPFTTIEDGEVCVDFDSLNRQFDASAAGGSRRKSDDLERWRPFPPTPWTAERWRIVERRADGLVLQQVVSPPGAGPAVLNAKRYVVDPESGLVTEWFRADPSGQLHSWARYLQIADLGGGIVFPRVVVEASFRNGLAAVLHVCAIDQIVVNEAIPESDFHLAAASHSRIVDHRGAKKLVSRLDRDQPDLVGWLKSHAPVPGTLTRPSSPPDDTLRNVLLTANGLLLIVVGMVLRKRLRASDVKTPA